jgi:hypothetical protein
MPTMRPTCRCAAIASMTRRSSFATVLAADPSANAAEVPDLSDSRTVMAVRKWE